MSIQFLVHFNLLLFLFCLFFLPFFDIFLCGMIYNLLLQIGETDTPRLRGYCDVNLPARLLKQRLWEVLEVEGYKLREDVLQDPYGADSLLLPFGEFGSPDLPTPSLLLEFLSSHAEIGFESAILHHAIHVDISLYPEIVIFL